MCRVENEKVSHIVSECKMLDQTKNKRGMAMYAGIFIGNCAKNITFREHNSGTTMNQMELLRRKGKRFGGILQSSVMPRLTLDDQILSLLIKPRRNLRRYHTWR